jgi:hypothetical protein
MDNIVIFNSVTSIGIEILGFGGIRLLPYGSAAAIAI